MTSSLSRRGRCPNGISEAENPSHPQYVRRARPSTVNTAGGAVPMTRPAARLKAYAAGPSSRNPPGRTRGVTTAPPAPAGRW
ncbi:hypothetical protein GCM10025872_11630 [Barrientosiimonas endolithica]|uniref:Uncharacterized protein n=1 Tax=Barrientosiimonas endolithica TaxID=1535208 RepID=A0ABN6YKJ7_9MICO|nr:hypothetical protein GCM10025872_11630 [Barrientosiimonas endolithica]